MLTLGMEGKKWQVFSSAVDLFAKHGYDNTSMRDIADACGIKSTSVYHYYPSKEALLETMYEFYYQNIESVAPDMEQVLASIPQKTAKEILFQALSFYEEDLQPYMDKIYLISVLRSMYDAKAKDLVWEYNFNHSERYFKTILNRMVEEKKIAPLDINSFVNLYTSFAFTAVFKQNTDKPVGMEDWLNALDFLFSTVTDIS